MKESREKANLKLSVRTDKLKEHLPEKSLSRRVTVIPDTIKDIVAELEEPENKNSRENADEKPAVKDKGAHSDRKSLEESASVSKITANHHLEETNSPTIKSMTPSDAGPSLYQDYQGLLQKLNEVALMPSKVKYIFDELKEQLQREVADIRGVTESKLREVDGYITLF
jgi:hypothetical protein